MKQVQTAFVNPPIPSRAFDWQATYGGYEPGELIGYGATEAEAIADLAADDDNAALSAYMTRLETKLAAVTEDRDRMRDALQTILISDTTDFGDGLPVYVGSRGQIACAALAQSKDAP